MVKTAFVLMLVGVNVKQLSKPSMSLTKVISACLDNQYLDLIEEICFILCFKSHTVFLYLSILTVMRMFTDKCILMLYTLNYISLYIYNT